MGESNHPLSIALRERTGDPLIGRFREYDEMEMPFSVRQLDIIADELDRLWKLEGAAPSDDMLRLFRSINIFAPRRIPPSPVRS